MPTAQEFQDGFGLSEGVKIGEFQVGAVSTTEKSIVRFCDTSPNMLIPCALNFTSTTTTRILSVKKMLVVFCLF